MGENTYYSYYTLKIIALLDHNVAGSLGNFYVCLADIGTNEKIDWNFCDGLQLIQYSVIFIFVLAL
jgi:hypothetical protein